MVVTPLQLAEAVGRIEIAGVQAEEVDLREISVQAVSAGFLLSELQETHSEDGSVQRSKHNKHKRVNQTDCPSHDTHTRDQVGPYQTLKITDVSQELHHQAPCRN